MPFPNQVSQHCLRFHFLEKTFYCTGRRRSETFFDVNSSVFLTNTLAFHVSLIYRALDLHCQMILGGRRHLQTDEKTSV